MLFGRLYTECRASLNPELEQPAQLQQAGAGSIVIGNSVRGRC